MTDPYTADPTWVYQGDYKWCPDCGLCVYVMKMCRHRADCPRSLAEVAALR